MVTAALPRPRRRHTPRRGRRRRACATSPTWWRRLYSHSSGLLRPRRDGSRRYGREPKVRCGWGRRLFADFGEGGFQEIVSQIDPVLA
jgi:hypothetical protein